MDDIFETRIKNYPDKEQEDLKIENFRPLSNQNKEEISLVPLTMNLPKLTLKKSSSYVLLNHKKEMNSEEIIKNPNDFNITQKTNSVNASYLFNNNINFTTLNEGSKNNLTSNKNNLNEKEKNIKPFQQLYSKNFSNLINSNDFTPNLGKYDKKIIITLNNKVKELENKLMKALNYYYQMENIYLSEIKKKGETEKKLNKSIKETNTYKAEYDKTRQANIAINNSLSNSRNELDRLVQTIKEEQQIKLKKQEDYNKRLIKEENERKKLGSIIKINDRQISILEEKLNYSKLSYTMKAKRYKEMTKFEKTSVNYENLMQKNEEIEKLKDNIKELQNEIDNLQKELKKGKEDKKKLMDEIKLIERKKKFNNDNINILHKTLDKQKEDDEINYNLVKSKNMIIKNMNNRANGFFIVPHYCLPKNIRINSAQKSKDLENNSLIG